MLSRFVLLAAVLGMNGVWGVVTWSVLHSVGPLPGSQRQAVRLGHQELHSEGCSGDLGISEARLSTGIQLLIGCLWPLLQVGREGAVRSTELVGTEMALLPLAVLVESCSVFPWESPGRGCV